MYVYIVYCMERAAMAATEYYYTNPYAEPLIWGLFVAAIFSIRASFVTEVAVRGG